MFRQLTLLATLTSGLVAVSAVAQDGSTSQPSTKPAGEVIDIKDFAKLKEMLGTEVSIRGKVTEVFVPQSGAISIFNFDGIGRRDFNVVVRKANLEAVNGGFEGDVAKAVTGQTIVVTGKVADYRGNPQIQVEKPEQIRIEKEGEKTE